MDEEQYTRRNRAESDKTRSQSANWRRLGVGKISGGIDQAVQDDRPRNASRSHADDPEGDTGRKCKDDKALYFVRVRAGRQAHQMQQRKNKCTQKDGRLRRSFRLSEKSDTAEQKLLHEADSETVEN